MLQHFVVKHSPEESPVQGSKLSAYENGDGDNSDDEWDGFPRTRSQSQTRSELSE